MQNKEEILFSLSEYKRHIKDYKKEFSGQKFTSLLEVVDKMILEVNNAALPKLDNWWYYEYRFTQFEFILDMCYCEDIEDDEYGNSRGFITSQFYSLIKIQAAIFTVEEFAKRFSVSTKTAINWINKGKIRAAKKVNNIWHISAFADKPSRKFEAAAYSWPLGKQIFNNEFSYLEGYNWLYIHNLEKDKFEVVLGYPGSDNRKTIEIDNNEREKLEYALLSLPNVIAEDNFVNIMFVLSKKMDASLEELLNNDNIKNEHEDVLEYGPVLITKGKYKGKIGYYDDDEDERAVVYFGDPMLLGSWVTIKHSCLSNTVSTMAIVKNINKLFHKIAESFSITDKYNSLQELNYCSDLLNNRYMEAMNKVAENKTSQIFISYSREDETFAKGLATDLIHEGYMVFLDQWSIDVGENIMSRISEGISKSNALIMLISKNYLNSTFCKEEWTSFYMKFAQTKSNIIYPIILDNANPPDILAARKYVRISAENDYSYNDCLRDLLKAMKKHLNK